MQENQHEHNSIWTIASKKYEDFLRTHVADFNKDKHDKKDIEQTTKLMRQLMVQHRGIGLSANQIGLSLRLFICQLPTSDGAGYKGKFYTIINPIIESASEKKTIDQEGCLSIPGTYGDVERSEKIIMSGMDKNYRPVRIKASGLLARIMQHELDHLNGVLFIDKAKNIVQEEGEGKKGGRG